ncbi:MAG TPA: ATP-binding protein [Steroidobacteraceae bacterium]
MATLKPADHACLAGGGEMGALMRSIDWSSTRLGPIESWPQSLRTMLGVVLGSRFPMLLWWGPELLHLYNDAYRPILRDKHPGSLAAPAAQIWSEIWDVAGPMAQSVLNGGPATWTEDMQLFINSAGMLEETYFTFSYSPVPGDDGRVGGLLNTVQETTVKVQSEREVRMLHDLAARAAEAKTEDEAARIALQVLAANELDLPFALLYAVSVETGEARLIGAGGWSDYVGPAKPARIDLDDCTGAWRWPLTEVIRGGSDPVIPDLAARFGPLPMGRWGARPESALVLALSRPGQSAPYALLIAGISPHRRLDDRYRGFFRATADQVATVLANARAYEEERERAAALAAIDRAKTVFFSNVSHEFRTPLTLMLGPLEDELAEASAPLPPARHARLQTAHRNTLRLLKLVNTLLDFSRIEAGRIEARYQATNLSAYTLELASVFRSAVEKGGLTLTVDCPPLPELAYVDRDMWEKIVLNLLSNAFKHTFQGGIRVALTWRGDFAELVVEDTGVGIPAIDLPRLFDRFHRVSGAKSRSHEGSGIGLALVQELARLHGGNVKVSSREGSGSRFSVGIRTGREHLQAESIESGGAAASIQGRATAFVAEALEWGQPADTAPAARAGEDRRPRILWADDNADMREYVRRLLADQYRVTAVADGAAALAAARTDAPDLVLSDVMMPRLDGFGLLRELRADEATRTIPVILLSARAGEGAAVEGLHAGADDYLVKPFSARELLARVGTHLTMAKMRRQWELELEARVRERTVQLLKSTEELKLENAERRQAAQKLEVQLARTNLLDQITRAVAERQDLRSIFQVVVGSVEHSLPVDLCCICLRDPESQALTISSIGQKSDRLAAELSLAEHGRIDVSQNSLARCLQGNLVYEPDLAGQPLPLARALTQGGLHSLVAAPLRVQTEVFGVLLSARRQPEGFSSGECEFLRQLSEHVALASNQAQLYQALQTAYEDLRHSQGALMQQERLRALGQMASGIAHDINNAISPIGLYTESLLEREPDLSERARASLVIIQRAIEDVAGTVARMRDFYRSRETQSQPAPVEINRMVEQVVGLTRARWSDLPQRRGVVIDLHSLLAPSLPKIIGVEGEIRDALTNLIFNAVDAMPDGGRLTLRSSVSEHGPVCVEVSDSGMGMDEAARQRCIEPFYTTKGERGTGLGLPMVFGMVQRHGAELQIHSAPGKGTTVRLLFPVAAADAPAATTPAPEAHPVAALRLLLIDDDALLRKSMQDILQSDGHQVDTIDGGQGGIDAFDQAVRHGHPYAAVITDLGMPHVDGRRVAEAVKRLSPATPVILLTGWGQRMRPQDDSQNHIDCVLGKPPRIADIRSALARLAAPAVVVLRAGGSG